MSNSTKLYQQALKNLNLAIEQLSKASDDINSDKLFDVIISLESNYDELSDFEYSLIERSTP